MAAERQRSPRAARKLVKLDSFWVPPELIDRLHATQEAMYARVGVRQSRAELLRAALSQGLDALDRKLSR
jgi:hypothetical protein